MKTYPLVTLIFLLPAIVFSQSSKVPSISVSGTGTVKGAPDLTVVDIRIVEEDPDYKKCLNEAMTVMSSLVKSFGKAGFDDKEFKTSNVNVREKKKWQEGKEIMMGYQASASANMEFQFSNTQLKKVFDVMSDYANKANYNISFKLSDDEKDRLVKSAIENAVLDAKKKAGIIASASEISLANIIEIHYGQSGTRPALYERSMSMSRAQSDTSYPDINPDEVSISENVLIRWAIE